jgi:predicted esterase
MTIYAAMLLGAAVSMSPCSHKSNWMILAQEGQEEKEPVTPEALWKLIDDGEAAPIKEAVGGDSAKLLAALKAGRPAGEAVAGERKERLTDLFGRDTDLFVVVPKKYDKAKPPGVLLLLHGLDATGAQHKELFRPLAEAQNYIIAAPTAQPEPADARNEDATEAIRGTKLKHWWSYRNGNFTFSALSDLKKRYAIDENRVVLLGYSMGGFGAWNIGLRYPDRFSAIVSLAGGFSRNEYRGRLEIDEQARKLHLNGFNLPAYFVHGDVDEVVPVEFSRESRTQLKKLGYEHQYVEIPKGKHLLNLREGGEILNNLAKWLAPRARKPHPREVKHFAIGDYCPRSYWVKIESFAAPSAEIRASIKDQTIDFTAAGVKKATFYADETLLDLSKPVKVTMGKEVLFEGTLEPSLEVLLESWRVREDREFLFRAKVTVDLVKEK